MKSEPEQLEGLREATAARTGQRPWRALRPQDRGARPAPPPAPAAGFRRARAARHRPPRGRLEAPGARAGSGVGAALRRPRLSTRPRGSALGTRRRLDPRAAGPGVASRWEAVDRQPVRESGIRDPGSRTRAEPARGPRAAKRMGRPCPGLTRWRGTRALKGLYDFDRQPARSGTTSGRNALARAG